MRRPSTIAPLLLAALLLPAACNSHRPLTLEKLKAAAEEPTGEVVAVEWHRGPAVSTLETGTARYVPHLLDAYHEIRARELIEFVDGYYRAPGNEGYDAVIERLAEVLKNAGFGADERLLLRVIETPSDEPAWTPRSASIALQVGDGEPEVLHAFDQPGGADRCMLPIHAPSCDVSGPIVLGLDELEAGCILVSEAPTAQVLRRAAARHAAAVVSASLETFNTDPTGERRHLDAIQFRSVPAGTTTPVFQISPRSFARIQDAVAERDGEGATLHVAADVDVEEKPLRTLCATIVGTEKPNESVVIVSHVQEPGACDNASGVVGLAESARSLAGLLQRGELPWPATSIDFVWGDEFVQSEIWLQESGREAVVGISSDMTGESFERTGAIALLERMPDPGALKPLPPDKHTPWGAGEVTAEDLRPNGLAVIARCALIDVGRHEGGWRSADHPWEGGSDHDVFAARGIPAVLFWHFTDFAYHTSLDRLDMVDSAEMRRTAAAISATALAVADARPGDLERYLLSLQAERELRVAVAEEADAPAIAEEWRTWTTGARHWLRRLCLGLDEEER